MSCAVVVVVVVVVDVVAAVVVVAVVIANCTVFVLLSDKAVITRLRLLRYNPLQYLLLQ